MTSAISTPLLGCGFLGGRRLSERVQRHKSAAQFEARRLAGAAGQVADGRLRDAALGGNLGLRDACCRKLCDEVLPVHGAALSVSVSRYSGTGLPIVNIGKLIGVTRDTRTAFGKRMYDSRQRMNPVPSQGDVAAAVGVSQTTLSEAETIRHGSRKTAEFARYYRCDAHWLATGEGEPNYRSGEAAVEHGRSPRRTVRRVWVVGKTQGGMPERIWNDGAQPIGSADQYAEVSTTDEHAFACRVVGDSMVPRYIPGEYALVEPGTVPELEDDVLVRLRTGETMLKRLLSRRGGLRLGSYNGAEILTFQPEEISWMYYVAHPIPAKRIRERMDEDPRDAPPTGPGDLPD